MLTGLTSFWDFTVAFDTILYGSQGFLVAWCLIFDLEGIYFFCLGVKTVFVYGLTKFIFQPKISEKVLFLLTNKTQRVPVIKILLYSVNSS